MALALLSLFLIFFVSWSVFADCDTCRWMAPDFFKRANEQSAVLAQPQTDEERLEAYKALLACPTCAPRHAGRDPWAVLSAGGQK